MPESVLLLGANSAIARAVARKYAAGGAKLFLVGRDAAKLEATSADLRVRGAGMAETFVADLIDFDRHREIVDAAASALGQLGVVLIAHGDLPDQQLCESNPLAVRAIIDTNFGSAMSLALVAALQLERQRSGTIAIIGSVAGDRGKRSNYIYGAAKAGLAVFLDGLRARLSPIGVQVLTIKPGFVDTPMTVSFKKGLLWTTPERAADAICRAIARRKTIVYVPWFWRPIMLIIRSLPEALFTRLGL